VPPGPNCWHLELTSFVGISLGASHTYARLDPGTADEAGRDNYDDFTIERVLTAEDAQALVDRDNTFQWSAGMTIRGFDTADEAIAAATAVFNALSRAGDSLVLYSDEDERLLAGPEGLEHAWPSRMGAGCTTRRLTALVERSGEGWALRNLEE